MPVTSPTILLVIYGQASVLDHVADLSVNKSGTVQVRNILVATGSKAQKIPIDGNEHGIISDEILALDRLPQR